MAWTVIVCFTVNCITPAVVAAKTLKRDAELFAAPTKTEFDLASDALIALEETLDRMDRRLSGKFEFAWQETLATKSHAQSPAAAKRADLAQREADIATNLAQLEAQQGTIQSYFAQTQADLKSHNIDASIQARAKTQSNQYGQLHDQLKTLLQAIKSAKSDTDYQSAVAEAASFLHAHSSKPKRAKFDPNHLAFGPPKERPRQAITDAAALRAALGMSGAQGSGTAASVAVAPKQATKDKSTRTTASKVTGKFTNVVSGVSSASLATSLSPTEDVQITPAVIAKAQALNNNALQIYQFVRNNVEYMPTYGSIEGSDYTLQTMRGNDIDQASLLIALLRASNIPAHYVYGTIRVPIEQVENWVGGVTDPTAALDLMGQGGIPTLGLTQGGVIKYAQIEHVWVEAQIRLSPSRGAVTAPGTTWVPMDPSFKQYAYTQGMNLQTAVPFDAQGFVNQIQSTSTINTTEGWVQNVDQNYINTQLSNYQTSVTNYVNNQNPNATVGDVIGTKTITPETLPMIPASLPYATVTTAASYDALPSTLRWAFHYQVDGEELLNQTFPSMAGKRLALSFSPVSQADQDALLSYIPSTANSFADLPSSIPAGLVRVQSQLSIDGDVFANGATYGLGDDVAIQEQIYHPGIGLVESQKTKHLAAGDYQVIAIDGTGISAPQVIARQSQLQSTTAKLQAHDPNGLTKHDVGGGILNTVADRYFVLTLAKAQTAASATGLVTYRLPSFGTVSTNTEVGLFFGIPSRLTPSGILLDMDRIALSSIERRGDNHRWSTFNQSVGSTCSFDEGKVPADVFSVDVNNPAPDASAVKALSVANIQGQRVYTITSADADQAMPGLNQNANVMQDIADAVNAGFTVTVSQSSVSIGGHTVAGYSITDPNSGGGSYRLDNGADGGSVWIAIGFILLIILSVILFQLAVVVGILLVIGGALAELLEILAISYSVYSMLTDIIKAIKRCSGNLTPKLIAQFIILDFIFDVLLGGESKYLPFFLTFAGDQVTELELEHLCPAA